jgi:hypothetical protein
MALDEHAWQLHLLTVRAVLDALASDFSLAAAQTSGLGDRTGGFFDGGAGDAQLIASIFSFRRHGFRPGHVVESRLKKVVPMVSILRVAGQHNLK